MDAHNEPIIESTPFLSAQIFRKRRIGNFFPAFEDWRFAPDVDERLHPRMFTLRAIEPFNETWQIDEFACWECCAICSEGAFEMGVRVNDCRWFR